MNISFVITGGTIDSYFDFHSDSIKPLEKTCLPKYIDSLKTSNIYTYHEVCMKDSRQLTIEDIRGVLDVIQNSEDDNFVVTHGTYTMPDTARYLESHLGDNSDKKIILTGSMIPLTGFSPSDAGFNLGLSIGSLNNLKPGVYVCMNGSLFCANEVAKLISDGRFVSLFNT